MTHSGLIDKLFWHGELHKALKLCVADHYMSLGGASGADFGIRPTTAPTRPRWRVFAGCITGTPNVLHFQ